jgi:hypothetical protein
MPRLEMDREVETSREEISLSKLRNGRFHVQCWLLNIFDSKFHPECVFNNVCNYSPLFS